MLELELAAARPPAAPVVAAERAQAVRCGERWVAFSYGWARAAVDTVQLSAVPGAPAWLAGAANVEGGIVPVIDLMAWAEPGRCIDARANDARLLVGGQGEDAVAFLFEGMPRLVSISRQPSVGTDDRLSAFSIGRVDGDDRAVALDVERLVAALFDELALH